MNQGKLEVVKQEMARVNEHQHFRCQCTKMKKACEGSVPCLLLPGTWAVDLPWARDTPDSRDVLKACLERQ